MAPDPIDVPAIRTPPDRLIRTAEPLGSRERLALREGHRIQDPVAESAARRPGGPTQFRALAVELLHLAGDLDLRQEDRSVDSGGPSTIPGQQSTAFESRPLGDLRIRCAPEVGRVAAHHPKIPGQAAQHLVGQKPHSGLPGFRR